MGDVSPATLQNALLRLQSRRLALIELIMSRRIEVGAHSPPVFSLSVMFHRLRVLVAYVRLRRTIRACEALRGGEAR